MSGDWIKMRCNLWDDPRVAKLCDLCDCGEAPIIGALYWLWATADQHTEDGLLPGLTLRQIDRKTGVDGFGDALCSIGWLADHPEGVRVVRFDEHNGASAKKRCQTARRVANHRAGNDTETQEQRSSNGECVTGALAREEKRREEEQEICNLTVATALRAEDRPSLALVKAKKPPDCPHLEVLALWAEVLPHAAQHLPSQWRGTRATHLRARWRETASEKGWTDVQQGLAYLRKLFGYVAQSPFLMGRAPPRNGGRPFEIELAWLVNPTNWAKVLEGKFHAAEATA